MTLWILRGLPRCWGVLWVGWADGRIATNHPDLANDEYRALFNTAPVSAVRITACDEAFGAR